MILRKNIKHSNDRSFTYARLIMPGLLHTYLKLPGKYMNSCPTTILTRDMRKLEMDWLIYVLADNETLFENILINVEQQSTRVDLKKIKDLMDYKDYSKTIYGIPVLTVVIITVDPEKSIKKYKSTESDILKPIYIYFTWEEIKKRLNNLTNKIENNQKLSEEESLDLAFIPMFSPKNKAKYVTKKLCKLYQKDNKISEVLKRDISFILEIMINKYFENPKEKEELLNMVTDDIRENAMKELFAEVDAEIEQLKTRNKQVENEKQELKNKNKQVETEKQELENKNKQVETEKQELENKNKQVETEKQELENKNKQVETEKQELENKNKQVETEKQELKNENRKYHEVLIKLKEMGN